jgi:hypothetical protein
VWCVDYPDGAGLIGVSGVALLLSGVLGVLSVLALSQVKSRRHVAELAELHRSDAAAILHRDFPPDFRPRRAAANDFLFIGVSMRRGVVEVMRDFRRMLAAGARVRVALIDPLDDATVQRALSRQHIPADAARRRASVMSTLDDLAAMRREHGGSLEIRMTGLVSTVGVNAFDTGTADGIIYVQHYEYRPSHEPSPISVLRPTDGYWYHHLVQEAERMWARPALATGPERAARGRRPAVLRAGRRPRHGDDARRRRRSADHRHRPEHVDHDALRPARAAPRARAPGTGSARRSGFDRGSIAADRCYADRTVDTLRERIRHSLRLLGELKRATGGDLEVRMVEYSQASGYIAADVTGSEPSPLTAVLVEYYAYRAGGEPKFVLTPAADPWFRMFADEAEALWQRAQPYDLDPLVIQPGA